MVLIMMRFGLASTVARLKIAQPSVLSYALTVVVQDLHICQQAQEL